MKKIKLFRNCNNFLLLLALLMVVAASLTACGYSNPYVQTGDDEKVKPDAVSIYVDMWQNKTSEFGFQNDIKQSIIRWLKKSPHFSIAKRPDQADYILDGVIKSIHIPGLSYGKWDRAVELRVEVTYGVELKKRKTGEVVLKKQDADWHESFETGSDAASLEMNKREALREIADNISENIYVNLFNKFSYKNKGKADITFDNTSSYK